VKTLYPVQQSHVNTLVAALQKHHAAIDSSSTGCGKTICAVEVAKALGLTLFVVCPKAVIPAWEKEVKGQGSKGAVINYEKLRTGKRYGRWDKKKWVWALPPNTLIVFDEAHRTKNPSSQNCKIAIASKGYHVLLLSATMADDPTEMRAAGYLTGLFELPKFWNWCRAHGCSPNPWGAMEFRRKNVAALEKIHAQIYPDRGSRLTVDDMQGHFAENFIVDSPLDFGDQGEIEKLYSEMDTEIERLKNEMADDSTNPAAQALVAQLRARQGVELLKVPTVIGMVDDALAEGRSVAVFVNFRETLDALRARITVPCEVIQGDQNATERSDAIEKFQSNRVHVILCNTAAGGVGVSLHDTTGERPRTALISPSFDAKALVQALGRIHRAGGKTPAYQRILVAQNTIEEKVAKSAKEKIIGQNILNGGRTPLSKESNGVSSPAQQNAPTMTTPKPDHASRGHAKYSPSGLKYFEICGSFKNRGGSTEAADRGTRIHEALDAGDITLLVDEGERAVAQKCADYEQEIVSAKLETGAKLLAQHNEIFLDIPLGGGEETFGTCDKCYVFDDQSLILIDYKTGYGQVDDAEINTQAWAYTLGAFAKFPQTVVADFFFLMPVRDEVSGASFQRSQVPEMRLRLQTIIARAKAGGHYNPQPGVCDYCGNKASCQALHQKAFLIAAKCGPGITLPADTDPITGGDTPESLAVLLQIAPVMEDWADQVKKRALELSLNEGWELPGYKLTERSTPRAITSALQAYEAVKDTVNLTDFLAACSKVSVPDLEKFFAEGLPRGKKGQGKQELVNRLTDAGCLKETGVIHVLKKEKA
jgi:superfamily II DNA or RNA helicase